MLRLNHWASRSRPHTAAAALILATGIIIISILPEIWDRWSSVGLSVMKFQFDWKMLAPTSPHISKHGICYGNVSFIVVYDLWSVGTFLYILLYLYPLRIYGLEERSAAVFLKCLACRCDMVVRGGDGGRENCDTVRIYSLSTSYNNNGVRIYSGTSHNNGGRPCFLGPTLLEVYRFHMCQQILQYNVY